MSLFFFLMIRRPPRSTRTDTLFPYTTLFRSILQRLNLRIDPDDRIALLGRNGNGKTTLARLLAAQLAPMDGAMAASGKMRVGYFTQYQVEELDGSDTTLGHMKRSEERRVGKASVSTGSSGWAPCR